MQKPKVAFSITTCKRVDSFLNTMKEFMNQCVDIDYIDQWYIIDDSSSIEDIVLMLGKYPNFIPITHKSKNQAVSINKILELEFDYVFHIEDDWHFSKPFCIKDLIEDLERNKEVLQLGLVTYDNLNYRPYKDSKMSYYDFNINSPLVPKNYRNILNNDPSTYNNLKKQSTPSSDTFWWPGFVFGPSIINLKKIQENKLKVDILEKPGIQEFTFACEVKKLGFIKLSKEIGIYHNNDQSSAFVLNNNHREWDPQPQIGNNKPKTLPTLISCFIDIDRGLIDNQNNEYYLQSLNQLLKLPNPLVIYTEFKNFKKILNKRNSNIQLINYNKELIENTEFWSTKYGYKHFNRVIEITESPEWVNQNTWMRDSVIKSKHYITLTLLKQKFLYNTAKYNYFNSDEFYWIDSGILSSFPSINTDKLLKGINNKNQKRFFITIFPYNDDKEMHGYNMDIMINRCKGVKPTYVT